MQPVGGLGEMFRLDFDCVKNRYDQGEVVASHVGAAGTKLRKTSR